MRNNIVHPGADELTYEIREIVEIGNKIEKTGVQIIWENIGDPIAKGQSVPQWIKEIIAETIINDDASKSSDFFIISRISVTVPDTPPWLT